MPPRTFRPTPTRAFATMLPACCPPSSSSISPWTTGRATFTLPAPISGLHCTHRVDPSQGEVAPHPHRPLSAFHQPVARVALDPLHTPSIGCVPRSRCLNTGVVLSATRLGPRRTLPPRKHPVSSMFDCHVVVVHIFFEALPSQCVHKK